MIYEVNLKKITSLILCIEFVFFSLNGRVPFRLKLRVFTVALYNGSLIFLEWKREVKVGTMAHIF